MTLLFGTGPAPSAPLNAMPITRAPVTVVPVILPTPAAPPVVAPAPTYAAAANPAAGQIQCYRSAPKLERVWLRSGGTALVCTPGNGSLTGWMPPHFPQGSGVGAGLEYRAVTPQMMAGASLQNPGSAARVAASNAVPTPPKGYKLAWSDDRLNPLRGVGTAQGQAQQDQVWTRTVPAALVAEQPQARAAATRAPATTVTVSTMSAPQAPVATSRAYVQVGTFGLPSNADGAKARLAALGFPVSTSKITRQGKLLQIVYAGPFGSSADAQAALATARKAGFGDAILR